jgi:hypothetical protein
MTRRGGPMAWRSRGRMPMWRMGEGLRVIDVSNPSSPREVGFYETLGLAEDVAVSGTYAYVADGEGGLVILRFLGAGARLYLPLVLRNR